MGGMMKCKFWCKGKKGARVEKNFIDKTLLLSNLSKLCTPLF